MQCRADSSRIGFKQHLLYLQCLRSRLRVAHPDAEFAILQTMMGTHYGGRTHRSLSKGRAFTQHIGAPGARRIGSQLAGRLSSGNMGAFTMHSACCTATAHQSCGVIVLLARQTQFCFDDLKTPQFLALTWAAECTMTSHEQGCRFGRR